MSQSTSHIVQLSKSDAARIKEYLDAHSFNPYESDASFERLAVEAFDLVKLMPPALVKQMLEFRRNGNQEGAVLIRGLPIDDQQIGSTPPHWHIETQHKTYYGTEMWLVACSTLLGEVYGFSTLYAGDLIQNLVPIKSDANEQVGTGSTTFLEWHVEDAFHNLRADFLALLCMRSDPAAASLYASIRHLTIPDHFKKALFEKKFHVAVDKVHGGSGIIEDGPLVSILEGPFNDPYIRFDPVYMMPLEGEQAARDAFDYLLEQVPTIANQVVLEQGDLLFLDNRRALHARTIFTPRYDGTDRWLQRVQIALDLRKSYEWRPNRFRIVELGLTPIHPVV